MNKLVTKILKESGVDAKITRSADKPKFRVKNGQLTLEGIVSKTKYSMTIKDTKNEVIDELSVSIKDANDIVNRINESINTLNKLSPIYDNHIKLQEDEEFEEIPDVEPGDIKGALNALTDVRDSIMDLANSTDDILDYFDDNEIEDKQDITGFVAGLYDIALDIEEFKEDKLEELEGPKDESFKVNKSKKSATRIALEHITLAQASLKGHDDCRKLYNALKDIKAELTLRGNK